jgi:DNA polymerase-4
MCSMPAGILHADLDAFYASVEQRDRPSLRRRPIAVGGGVVLSASYEARVCGVRSAMSLREARDRCPGLVVVEPRMSAYTEASRAVFEIFRDTTPVVEPVSIDEAFLDVNGLWRLAGTPASIAVRLRARVSADVGLPISVGVARTKFLAKVASAVAKPDGLLVVDPDAELEFLHPLPVRRLWGVGPVAGDKLAAVGVVTVGQVAGLGERALISVLGAGVGRHIHALASNRDPRPVIAGRRRASIGAQRALGRGSRSLVELEAVLLGLVDRVAARLRDGHRVGRTVVVRFRFGDFASDTRSRTLSEATDSTDAFARAARDLVAQRGAEIERRGLTLLGITIANLSPANAVQLALPFDRRATPDLDQALDVVRRRYGSSAIRRAAMVGRSPGHTVPLLPDPVDES